MANYKIEGNQTDPLTGQLLDYYQQNELVGDVVINGEIVNWSSEGTNTATILTISPVSEDNIDYTVAAVNFSCTNLSDLSSRVSNVLFTDSGTPGTTENTVLVTVYLQPTFQLDGTASNDTITLNISGSATEWVDPNVTFEFPIIVEQMSQVLEGNIFQNSNSTPTITMNSGFYKDTIVTGDISENLLTGVVIPNTPTEIGTLSVTGDSGYYFEKGTPHLSLVNTKSDIIKLVPSGITRNSNKRITSYNFKIVYKNDKNLKRNSASKAFLKWKTIKEPTRTTKEIKEVTYGDSTIKKQGETRSIKINGDPDAEFELTVTDLDGTSIMNSRDTNASIFHPTKGIVKGISKKLKSTGKRTGLSVYSFDQIFTANTGYRTTINGSKTSTTITINGNTSNIKVGDQLIYSGIVVGIIATVVSITDSTNVVLDNTVAQVNGQTVRFIRNEKYYINIYPKTGTTLNSSIPTVVPHFTLNQYKHPVITLTCTSTHDSTSITPITYQGRANAYPDKVRHLRPTVPDAFKITWSFTATSGNWGGTTPTWSSVDSTKSSWTNSVYADNGGMHIEITDITMSGSGTSSSTLTAVVFIKKWGTKDVTMHLDLDAAGWVTS